MDRPEVVRLRIRAARESRQLTQQDVADLMGISQNYYQKVESGARVANLRFIRAFCHAVGASVGEIVTDASAVDDLLEEWPEGFRILQRVAKGPQWQREKLQKLFEVVYGDDDTNDKDGQNAPPARPKSRERGKREE